MKHVSVFVLAAILGLASIGRADSTHTTTSGGDVTVTATGGAGGAGGRADSDASATGIGFGGSASNRNDVDTKVNTDVDVRNSANSGSFSGASSDQKQGQIQGQEQGQSQSNEQGINAFNGNTTTVEAPDVKGMGKELAKHASSAAEVRSSSSAQISPCGDASGLSAQAGLFGGALATVPETCRAARLQALETVDNGSFSTTLAQVTYYGGWFPRFMLHIVTAGVLN